MPGRFLALILLVAFLVTSCGTPATANTSDTGDTADPPSEAATAEAPFVLTTLLVEGTSLDPQDNIFAWSSEVRPGDSLRVEAVVESQAPGTISVLGKTQAYEPGANTVLLISIPDAMASPDIEIQIDNTAGEQLTYALRLEKPGAGFRPAIVAELPSSVHTGQLVLTPLAARSLSGQEYAIETVDQVAGLGDRYSGNEYVTSQQPAQLSWNGRELTFLAETPGNYRLQVEILNGSASEFITFDIPVRWPPGESPFSIRGVAIDTWGPPEWVDLENVPAIIDLAASYGANYIQLAPYWNAAGTKTDNEIVPCGADSGCTTPDDELLREWIRHAHSKNMHVLLKPHLIGGRFDPVTVGYDFESWEIKPSDPDAWFADYTEFIMHYAQIAFDEHVDMLAIGNELNGTQLDTAHWTQVVEAVHSVYTSPLTYSDPLLWQVWDGQARFWDQLDYIGIPYYYLGPNTTAPHILDIEAAIQKVQARNLTRAMNDFGQPMIATEFGRPNFDGTSRNFVDWSNATVDNQEAVDYIEAAFNTMVDLGRRFQGVFIWKLSTTQTSQPIDWDFRQKPLGEAIRFWFSN